MNLRGRDFLKLLDFTPAEITYLIDLAAELKAKKKAGIAHRYCAGMSAARPPGYFIKNSCLAGMICGKGEKTVRCLHKNCNIFC